MLSYSEIAATMKVKESERCKLINVEIEWRNNTSFMTHE
jgi:hypothetical protein